MKAAHGDAYWFQQRALGPRLAKPRSMLTVSLAQSPSAAWRLPGRAVALAL
jgi:hypothetical protein